MSSKDNWKEHYKLALLNETKRDERKIKIENTIIFVNDCILCGEFKSFLFNIVDSFDLARLYPWAPRK